MNTKTNLKNTMRDPKSRVFFFLMLSIIVIVSFMAYSLRSKQPTSTENRDGVEAKSTITTPSLSMESIAGVTEPSKEYLELQQQKEQKQAEKALSDTGAPSAALPSLSLGTESEIPEFKLKPEKQDTYQEILNKQLDEQRILQQKIINQQRGDVDNQEARQREQQIQSLLARQVKLLSDNWQTVKQSYVSSTIKTEDIPRSDSALILKEIRKLKDEKENPKIYYKAGDILFGVILTAVNSDEPGPVLARVISGPLANSKIIGTINPKSIPKDGTDPRVSKSLVLEFNLLNVPGTKRSTPVKAVAIDPQTARTSLATSVDNHYLLRYGTFFASAFLSGLGDAVSTQNQGEVITDLGSRVNVGSQTLNSTDEIKIAAGKTAQKLSDQVNLLAIPPTIKISSGTAVGILLQQDLVLGGDDEDLSYLLGNGASAGNQNVADASTPGSATNLPTTTPTAPVTSPRSSVGGPVIEPG